MSVERIDHIAQGLDALRSQWKGKVGIEGILASYLKPLQDVEDSGMYLLDVSIFNAVNEELDIYGFWYGVNREERDDESFRAAILSRVSLAEADASPEGILEAVRAYGQTDQVDLWQHYPCYVPVYMGTGYIADMYSVLQNLAMAGVETALYFDDNGDSLQFTERFNSGRLLVNEGGENFVLDRGGIPFLWAASIGTSEQLTDKHIPRERGDIEFAPLMERASKGVISLVGRIVDEDGNYIVDEEDNYITFTEIKFKERQ